MKKKIIVLMLLIIILSFSLAGCSKEKKLDNSDNNIKPITIENLASTLRDNPYKFEKLSYIGDKISLQILVQYGKNAYFTTSEQIGVFILCSGYERLTLEKTYEYYMRKYTIDEKNLVQDYETVEINVFEYKYSNKNLGENFDDLLKYYKKDDFSGYFFDGFYEYLEEKGENIFQVKEDKIEIYGKLAADSFGAKGVEHIIKSAESLKIELLNNNEVKLSYIAGYDLIEIKIYDIGKNYRPDGEAREYIDKVNETGKSYYWSLR